jgi:enoyl-CoA hydratase/carnithine racemase
MPPDWPDVQRMLADVDTDKPRNIRDRAILLLNGLALGGGFMLINVFDLAICSSSASIGCPEISFATYPAMAVAG